MVAMSKDRDIAINDLYPRFTAEELTEAEANLRRYLAVLVRMAERLAAEGRSINDLADSTELFRPCGADLTVSREVTNIHDERSNPPHH